ncbi:hypothetical protein B1A_09442 [mine drainage metagenome]|uniref:Uncharacterized protein n=1 Tax=mine drainage metagenome TaxID=410659 RepID=T1CAP9_9ZZZZ
MTREIKKVGKYDYVYESSMSLDSDHRKRHKVSRYVGKVVNGDVDNPKRVRDIVAIRGIYEIGHLELAWSVMDDITPALREE